MTLLFCTARRQQVAAVPGSALADLSIRRELHNLCPQADAEVEAEPFTQPSG